MAAKSMTTKQAEKWLDKVKSSNLASFKEINKVLKRYERTNDEHDCFIKLNTILLDHPDLTNDLNTFLDEGHRFVINRSQVERINDLVKYIKKVDPKAFNEIVKMITSLSNQRGSSGDPDANEDEQNHHLINFVLEQVKNNHELAAYANKALYYSAQQLIQTLDLSHLRSNQKQEIIMKPQESYEIVRQPPPPKEEKIEPQRPVRRYYPPFLSANDQKVYLRQLEATSDPIIFQQLIKILEVYQLGIISKDQTIEILKGSFNESDFIAIKDIIESRESDRRRNCCFRPLSDMDFSNSERATHSYVTMPDIYPHFCSGKNSNLNDILNKDWISVPRGSEDTFNIRVKNTHEENLIKAEDDRYQFDIFFVRLKKSLAILDKICEILQKDPQANIQKQRKLFLGLGVIQTLYKNCSKEQKQEFQFYLAKIQLTVANLFRQRLKNMKAELQEIRTVHGLKNWNQISFKNWNKSLDIKGHEFKRIEKMKIKHTVFLEELKKKASYLRDGQNSNDEQESLFSGKKKEFFEVFNSFSSTSRKQKCMHRNIPTPIKFQMKKNKNNCLLPAIIMAFQDQQALSMTYSLISFSLDHSTNDSEKNRCKNTLKSILSQFLKVTKVESHSLASNFDEEIFFGFVNKDEPMVGIKVEELIQKKDESGYIYGEQNNSPIPKLNVEQGETCFYDYLPAKNDKNMVFYASESFYVFIRFLYTLYERVIRMREIVKNQQKALLFEILYFSCIKCKESSRFQEALIKLLGSQSAYIFTTFYRLVENLCKSLNAVSLCAITNQSLKIMKSESEAAYIQLLNNYLLANGLTTSKLVRCTFDLPTKLLYINHLDSRYINEEQIKQLPKRRAEMTQKIQIYTIMGSEMDPLENNQIQNTMIKNRTEYCFQGNSIKLVNLASNQDILIKKKTNSRPKTCAQDLKKTMGFLNKIY